MSTYGKNQGEQDYDVAAPNQDQVPTLGYEQLIFRPQYTETQIGYPTQPPGIEARFGEGAAPLLPSNVQSWLRTDYGFWIGWGAAEQQQRQHESATELSQRLLPISASPAESDVVPTPSVLSTPTLIRTSTMQPHTSDDKPSEQPFNPYLIYQSKAILKIEGDLGRITEAWTGKELEAKRRLVQFDRSQSGTTITTSFAPVTPEAVSPDIICVSCILWEEKGECFITSVDVIFLLEALVNVRFTLEEKNRIRRRLEQFRPLTVSKAQADTREFFGVIMGFPMPTPRKVKKDIKVFPWKELAHALKKIIETYSASHSSTAGPLPSLLSGTYRIGNT